MNTTISCIFFQSYKSNQSLFGTFSLSFPESFFPLRTVIILMARRDNVARFLTLSPSSVTGDPFGMPSFQLLMNWQLFQQRDAFSHKVTTSRLTPSYYALDERNRTKTVVPYKYVYQISASKVIDMLYKSRRAMRRKRCSILHYRPIIYLVRTTRMLAFFWFYSSLVFIVGECFQYTLGNWKS